MHIQSSGQPRVGTGVSGEYTRKQPVSSAGKSIGATVAERLSQGQFADLLTSAIAPSGSQGRAFDATLHEQLNLVEIEPVARQNSSGEAQKTAGRSAGRDDGAGRTTPASAAFSTKGNLVNLFA